MKHHLSWITLGLAALVAPAVAPGAAVAAGAFEWKDGDRVVLIGDTLIERDQKFGYLETLVTAANPDKTITFRNLGWSGDTVRGLSRARFGPPAEGYQHLIDHVRALKPTVLIVGYGMADSFDGAAGLPAFVSGLNETLDALAGTKARLIVLSPLAHLDLGRPLPDPAAHNKALEQYTAALARIAAERKGRFVDVFHEWLKLGDVIPEALTDNGIHLTDAGSWLFAVTVAKDLLGGLPEWRARFHHNGRLDKATGTTITVDATRPTGVRFKALDATLPVPLKTLTWGKSITVKVVEPRVLVAEGLPDGRYRPTIDGEPVNSSYEVNLSGSNLLDPGARLPDEAACARGLDLKGGPEYDQVEALRKAINRKNELYFYRWRPQNETYLFGFRKHEQGNNAREIPLFDPLVEAQEKEIARLKKPVPHVYELVKVKESEVSR